MNLFEHTNQEQVVAFLQTRVPQALQKIKSVHQPAWGKMTAQHMVEHLTSTVLVSTILSSKPPQTPTSQQLQTKQSLLYNAADLPRNLQNPAFQFGLPAYTNPDLETAKQKLLGSLPTFFRIYAAKPGAVSFSPFLGDLQFQEWLVFHAKHFRHHFTQFNLL
ncbi:MAG: hypothetical protein H7Z75_05090 [Ferruginibacter sp.]|nr:hypothetical protein [Cytophagales bacterium]